MQSDYVAVARLLGASAVRARIAPNGPSSMSIDLADGLGLAQNWGVVIADVIPGGPADAGGIRAGDIVLSVDGHPILGLPGFTASLYQHPTDQVLKIDVLRGARKLSLDIPAVLAHDRIDRTHNRNADS
jgi:S1-C subfamily serine protease